MNGLQEAVLKRAKEYNFQLRTSDSNKLKEYVFNEIITPMVDNVTKVRTDFYNVTHLSDGIEIVLVDKKIKLQTAQDNFCILEDRGDSSLMLLSVVFENDIAHVKGNDRFNEPIFEQLTYSHLTEAIKRLYQ
ncbi:hypothetical protein ACOSZE_09320 [Lysinibacillus fusiformis]|uniref:hypothetical protein n=1 Tax=Lysinibacillus fusiformis TaxID=28031 RepID=UPI003BA10AE5